MKYWKNNGNRGVWFNVHLTQANWVPILAQVSIVWLAVFSGTTHSLNEGWIFFQFNDKIQYETILMKTECSVSWVT